MASITLNPVTRIEGHLSIHTDSEPDGQNGFRITAARCEGEMFRGIETILEGRDPLDAQQVVQRICGVCPVSHGLASIYAQEAAYSLKPSHNGRILRNLVLAANYLQSHVLHFYHLAALDFVDVKSVLQYGGKDRTVRAVKAWVEHAVEAKASFPAAPFLPRYEVAYIKDADRNARLLAHYVQALDIRRTCHEMAAVFGGRMPHPTTLVPGGCTQVPSIERIMTYRSRLEQIETFINEVYLPDVLEVAGEFPEYFDIGQGHGSFLSFGAFREGEADQPFLPAGTLIGGKFETLDPQAITETTAHSRFASGSAVHPASGQTAPEPGKSGAYSWIKAPRYRGQPMEVGPLARLMVLLGAPQGDAARKQVAGIVESLKLPPEKLLSVLGRHLARGLEATWIAKRAYAWLDQLEVDGPPAVDFDLPKTGRGCGLVEAPRGALGHWLEIANYRIKSYQCVVPTTWNCSPRDEKDVPGPVEKALQGTLVKDPAQPVELGRIVRSFDPCIACAVH